MSESLFNFAVVRPPISVSPAAQGVRLYVSLIQQSPLQQKIASAATPGDAKKAADEYSKSPAFLQTAADTPLRDNLSKLGASLDVLSNSAPNTGTNVQVKIEDLDNSVKAAGFPNVVTVQALFQGNLLNDPVTRLKDTIVAIKILPELQRLPIDLFIIQLEDIEALRTAHEVSSAFPMSAFAFGKLRTRPLYLPSIKNWPTAFFDEQARKNWAQKLRDQYNASQARNQQFFDLYHSLREGIADIRKLKPTHFLVTELPDAFQAVKSDSSNRLSLVKNHLAFETKMADIHVEAARRDLDRPVTTDTGRTGTTGSTSDASEPPLKTLLNHQIESEARFRMIADQPALKSIKLESGGLRLNASGQQALAQQTVQLLKDHSLADFDTVTVPHQVLALTNMMQRAKEELDKGDYGFEDSTEGVSTIRTFSGRNSLIAIETTIASATRPKWEGLQPGSRLPPLWPNPKPSVPQTHGKITAAGVMDLIIVKQTLMKYERGDVAHIENILKGENMKRDYTSKRTTETLIFNESETTNSEERQLESTDRFEMSKETQQTIQKDAELKGGMSISASYGPFVEFSANASTASKTSTQEAENTATKFSTEVINKSLKKITERVLERSSIKTTNEITELTSHGIDNSKNPNATNISGVYQWVNKVYECQMWNHGSREMYEFMIPEPAAYYLYLQSQPKQEPLITIAKPPPYSLLPRPNRIRTTDYSRLMRVWGVELDPPPPLYDTKAAHFVSGTGKQPSKMIDVNVQLMGETLTFQTQNAGGPKDGPISSSHSDMIAVPPGYQTLKGAVTVVGNFGDGGVVEVIVGRQVHRWTTSGTEQTNPGWEFPMDAVHHSETTISGIFGSISMSITEGQDPVTTEVPWAVTASNVDPVAITVQLYLTRTDEALRVWQKRIFKTLLDRHKQWTQEYDDALANATAQLSIGSQIATSSANPLTKENIIRTELKKACITVLTDQQFDLFNAIDETPVSLDNITTTMPQINIAEAAAEGAYVAFFEQAFEWHNLTYVPYPYYWARKQTWVNRMAISDPDPTFEGFLKAGYARVQVPVRDSHRDAVRHFLEWGGLWGMGDNTPRGPDGRDGNSIPTIVGDVYLPIAEEQADSNGRPDEKARKWGKSWTVRVPTTLIKLRKDDDLPEWQRKRGPDGEGDTPDAWEEVNLD
ncbi:hypothetical protein IQ07DRAFT_630356 [Pyrenochaeta sp. DS3sAY3a]|nr:hypothetical protein IQ07DRAFT_630356 [Pyrenochaeta sp. DS3sAY3a]